MSAETSPLRIGSRVCFADRWQGRVTAIDVSEDWEVLNVTVTSGVLLLQKSVKLPFSAATKWSDEALYLEANSFKAFAREIPPVAAPSRPLSRSTPIAHAGTRLAGLLVRKSDRRAAEVLVSRGPAAVYRVPVAQVSFDGKVMSLGTQAEALPEFRLDDEILQACRGAIANDLYLTSDDKLGITLRVENAVVTVGGNVRVKPTRRYIEALLRTVPGVLDVRDEIVDDISLETAIGLALDRAGLTRNANIYARSNVGEVVVYGTVSAPGLIEDIVRETARVPGVRQVQSRITVSAAA